MRREDKRFAESLISLFCNLETSWGATEARFLQWFERKIVDFVWRWNFFDFRWNLFFCRKTYKLCLNSKSSRREGDYDCFAGVKILDSKFVVFELIRLVLGWCVVRRIIRLLKLMIGIFGQLVLSFRAWACSSPLAVARELPELKVQRLVELSNVGNEVICEQCLQCNRSRDGSWVTLIGLFCGESHCIGNARKSFVVDALSQFWSASLK